METSAFDPIVVTGTDIQFETAPIPYETTNQQPYKSAEEKFAYSQQIITRIRPYLALHAEDLNEEIEAVSKTDIKDFIKGLETAWQQHIDACDAIVDFLETTDSSVNSEWSPQEWVTARKLSIAAFDTDRDKTIYSSGIKTVIETRASRLAQQYDWSDSELLTCLTPKHPPFHTKYNVDHMEISYARRIGEVSQKEAYAIKTYHHGDRQLFELRLADMPHNSLRMTVLGSRILHSYDTLEEEQKKKQRFLAKYPEAKDIDRLLEFDNWNEYVYVYSQAAYPDMHMREEVIWQAKVLGIVEDDRDALSFKKEEILDIIDNGIARVENNYRIPVRNYLQTVTSCGVSCLMTLAGRNGMPHDRKTEIKLWRLAGAPYNFPGGIASLALDAGFRVTYVVDQPVHFTPATYPVTDIEKNPETQRIAEQYVALHNQAAEKGMTTVQSDFSFEDIVEGLKNGWFAILGLHLPDSPSILHWVLAHGYWTASDGQKRLELADPMGVFSQMSDSDLDNLSPTYMGKRVLFIHKNNGNLESIV